MSYHFAVDGGGEWELTDAQLLQWQQLYRGVDVDCECRKAWAWLDANPDRRKTARGMKRFLVNWLNKCKPEPSGNGQRPDMHGHYPPCATMQECTRRALAEAKGAQQA